MIKIDKLIYVKGRRSVGIQIKDGLLIIRAPKGLSDKKLNAILKEREGWISKKLAEYRTSVALNYDVISHSDLTCLIDPMALKKTFDEPSSFTYVVQAEDRDKQYKHNHFHQRSLYVKRIVRFFL